MLPVSVHLEVFQFAEINAASCIDYPEEAPPNSHQRAAEEGGTDGLQTKQLAFIASWLGGPGEKVHDVF